MAGTHYTLSRDTPHPMTLLKEKACRTCGITKPNTFDFFSKKLWMTRDQFTTLDVCRDCQRAKVSQGMRNTWERKATERAQFHAHQTELAAAAAQAATVAAAQQSALAAELADEDPTITPIPLAQSTEPVAVRFDRIPETRPSQPSAAPAMPAQSGQSAEPDEIRAIDPNDEILTAVDPEEAPPAPEPAQGAAEAY